MGIQPLISIVDDDEGVRTSLDGLVRSLGYRAAVFDSAESFLASDAPCESGCVISDVQMPGMDGFELLRSVRRGRPDVPVILISAFVNAGTVEEAKEAGAYCTLRKPFDGEDLVTCLARALEG